MTRSRTTVCRCRPSAIEVVECVWTELRHPISIEEEEQAAPQRKKTKAEQKVTNILEAKDLSHEEYEDISKRKNMGKTTAEENLQAEKHY